METAAIPGPARPAKLTVQYHADTDQVFLRTGRGGGPGFFLSLWLIGWTVACVALAAELIVNRAVAVFFFAVPFWTAWLVVAAFLTWLLLGRETLLLRRDAAYFRRSAIIELSARVIPRREIQAFRECQSRHTENDHRLWGIELVSLGKPLRFAFRLPDLEREWLVHELNQFLHASEGVQAEGARPDGAQSEGVQRGAAPRAATEGEGARRGALVGRETLKAENTLTEPPLDCAWTFADRIDALEFLRQGKRNFGAIALLLPMNAFWNGIVVIFISALFGIMPMANNGPQGWEWWGLFVFLIPFEGIGLVMFAALFAAVLEPFRRTQWRFGADRIDSGAKWLGYQRWRAWEVDKLDRLELRWGRGDVPFRREALSISNLMDDAPFELALVTVENVDLCSIEGLSQGEARWMARIVLERRSDWFAR